VNSIVRLTTLGWLVALSACAAPSSQAVPVMPTAAFTHHAGTMDGGSALPGDGGSALPGDGGSALPGAQLVCALPSSSGYAGCTIAININVAPLASPSTPASLIPGLHPGDLQAAYALPSENAGETVAIVDAYDDPSIESDLSVYRNAFGLPPCTSDNGCFRKVNERGVAGSYPAANDQWSQEIALDAEMVSAVCPHCSILLVEANSASIDDLGTSVDTAVGLGARVISNSYYASEWSGESAEEVHYQHPGVAVTVSSGDTPAPSYPAASQYVTAVGGTTLTSSGETAWADGGRGCSAYIARPRWQSAGTCATRSAVDVAAVADPQTGVAMFDAASGGWLVAGGTSVGAPIVGAAYALTGSPKPTAYSYGHPADFHDIGGAGYALATGLGSPNGVAGL